MPFYRKKPVVVEAMQWKIDNFDEIAEFVASAYKTSAKVRLCRQIAQALQIWIPKSNAFGWVSPLSWVIKELDGDGVYPCTEDEFSRLYERVVGLPAPVEEVPHTAEGLQHTGSCEKVHATRTHEEWSHLAGSLKEGFDEGRENAE